MKWIQSAFIQQLKGLSPDQLVQYAKSIQIPLTHNEGAAILTLLNRPGITMDLPLLESELGKLIGTERAALIKKRLESFFSFRA